MKNTLQWLDPQTAIWGFHVHQELPKHQFAQAMATQEACHQFLQARGVPVDADDAIAPGYGPHLDYMWELRVESLKNNVLKHLGAAISYMSVNRFGLSGYIHPVMHDPNLSDLEALKQEGETNQLNALWFGYRVAQNQDFFFNPPLDEKGEIIDTRTERLLATQEREVLRQQGREILPMSKFRDPKDVIIRGFHIHMDFIDNQTELAGIIFDKFMIFLLNIGLCPTSTRHYAPRENGPHVLGGWEVKFETRDAAVLENIGIAVGWLMCNRQNISVFMHPVTWEEGDNVEEINAHENYGFFLGQLAELDLDFFRK